MAANGFKTRKITRADVRNATIAGLKRVKADPRSVKLTPGQRLHIVKSK